MASLWDVVQQALLAGANTSKEGGNTNQVQGAQQSGSFNTTDTSTANEVGLTQNLDTLGLGNLLASQGGDLAATDASRQGFLTSSMLDPTNLQAQTNQAVNTAMSGPGMQGVGNMARARAGGVAAADVGRNALTQQLQAASQLNQPGLVQQAAQTGAAYNGQLTGKTAATGQNTQGTATGESAQVGYGNQPVAQSSGGGGGGTVVCSAMHRQGYLSRDGVLIGRSFATIVDPDVYTGYVALFNWLARLIRFSKVFAWLMQPIVNSWVKAMKQFVTGVKEDAIIGKVILYLFVPICFTVGSIINTRKVFLCGQL